MNELRTPEILSTQAENELICEKLFGFVRGYTAAGSGTVVWRKPATENRRVEEWYTPSFTTWADAGLILEALQVLPMGEHQANFKYQIIDLFKADVLDPLAIRSAALQYIKAMKS